MSIKKVLIAHQSTIPHYRVAFYQAVEKFRPRWWEFSVIYDPDEARGKFFVEPAGGFNFRVKPSRTYHWRFRGKEICFQTFPLKAWEYDLLVVGSEVHNISYPLSYFWRFSGKSIAYWGHGRDCSADTSNFLKMTAERAKIWLTSRANGFFAYTSGVREYMINKGVNEQTIFTLFNTIDINEQRQAFHKLISERRKLKKAAGLEEQKVLLFVGRLTNQKRLPFLLDTFVWLTKRDPSYHIIVVGGGDASFIQQLKERCGERSVTYRGVLYGEALSPLYVVSDLYVYPGAVGLGPLEALCFDVTPAVIHSTKHKPEYEYLNHDNALILPSGSTAEQYARAIMALLEDRARWADLRAHAWPSIRHLTIENMAQNFIDGVNAMFLNQ